MLNLSRLFNTQQFGVWFLFIGVILQIISYVITGSSWISLISGITGIISVVLCAQRKISFYLFGYIQLVTYCILAYQQNFYGELIENVFYAITMVYGLIIWFRHKDINSILIFITGHQELDRIVMKNDFLFLAFINKFDNCEERLMNALDKSLKLFQIKKVIKFKDNGIMYSIPLDDILYITRDSIDRKCIIVTDYSEFRVSKNLNEIEGMVNANFIKTHRACLINKKRITSYNKPKRIVTFDNGTKTDLISTRFDKELI